jgi:hypothetical protein
MYGDQGVAAIPEPLQGREAKEIKMPGDKWSDERAFKIVKSDFAYAESYRVHAHDWRYRNASELYLAWAGQRYWDGTRVPRSSLGIYVVFEQVESMLPKIVDSLCDPESYDFFSDNDDAAALWKQLILKQLEETHYREQIRLAAKSSLIYGNGILEWGMEDYEDEIIEFERSQKLKNVIPMQHPIAGWVNIPQSEVNYKRKINNEKKRRPYLKYRSIIDCYVNPNCESPCLQSPGNYFIYRTYMAAEDLKAMRGMADWSIPDDDTLAEYSKAKTTANQDVTKLSAELFRYNMWNPALDYSSDPGLKRIETIWYTTADRKITLLNREHVAYNQPNKYRKINYYSMHYADVLDRWHALAISDVAEGEQRLQQAIINGRVDELALSLHPPMIKKRGVTIPPYQLKTRPGVVIETENPEGDIKVLEVQNITQQAFIEVEASERRTQRITGMSDLAALGSPTSGGNSANRTAAGINTQVGATQDRARYYISNSENETIEPILNSFIWLNKRFMDPKLGAAWIKLHKDYPNIDPLEVMNAQVVGYCYASVRLQAKANFLQNFPTIAQVIFNPELLQMLAQQQKKTISIEAFERCIWDSISYTPRSPLIVDMNPQQKQAMQQPPPAEKLQAMIAQMQDQTNKSVHDNQNITKLLTQLLKSGFDHHKHMEGLDDAEQQHQRDTAKELLLQHMQGQQQQQLQDSQPQQQDDGGE